MDAIVDGCGGAIGAVLGSFLITLVCLGALRLGDIVDGWIAKRRRR